MIPTIRVTTIQPAGSCHECGQMDHGSPYILVQRRRGDRPVDSEDTYCGRCEPTIMERLQQQHTEWIITLIDER